MTIMNVSRRGFLAQAGGLVIAVSLPSAGRAQGAASVLRPDTATGAVFSPNAFVRIGEDDLVTVIVHHLEMGQGSYTGIPMLVAEELDADWGQMRVTSAPADVERYVNPIFGIQGTGGSTGLASSWEPLRRAGATARAMLVEAAAREWDIPAEEITVVDGRIAHEASGNESGLGAMAQAAVDRGVEAPADVRLKEPSEYKLIGKQAGRLDSASKSDGSAIFTMDVMREGQEVVSIVHPPKFGATVASFDPSAALEISGVNAVREVPTGIAVYADNTWAAFKGREAVDVTWDDTGAETRSSEQMYEIWAAATRASGRVAEASGDVEEALASAATTHEAEYVFPMLAHTPMEPLDGVIELTEDGAEAWLGSQLPTVDHQTVAGRLGMELDQVQIHSMMAGGSFGRRATPQSHFAGELAEVARAAGPGAYKLVWTRENDVRGGYYRPITVHRLRGGLDADGNIVAWDNGIANQSIIAGSPFEMLMEDGVDATSIEGATRMPYAWPAHRVSWSQMESRIPVLWWRSVGHTHTGYATETFLDELLEMGGKDAIAGRLELIQDSPRDRGVLERVADMANWSGPDAGNGRMLGVALHESFQTYVAMIAEVEERNGLPHTTRMWCAVDCGIAVNPDVVVSQMEGGMLFGLGTAMFNEITMARGGEIVQSNWHDYRMLRINEQPRIEVSIIDSSEAPTGVGEPGTPPVAPAVGNAWRALTGRTPRRMPFQPVSAV